MKKAIGNFTMDAGKAIKGADRIFCRIDEEKMVYICTGYFVFRMNGLEYAETVQPVTKCDAGDWIIERGEKREAGPADFNPVDTFRKTVETLNGKAPSDVILTSFPGTFPLERGEMVSYYNASAGFAAFYNRAYMAAFAPGLLVMAASNKSAALIYNGEEAVGMVLPVRPAEQAARAVKAYFVEPGSDAEQAAQVEQFNKLRHDALELETERNALRRELDDIRGEAKFTETERAAMRETITEQADEISSLRNELDALRAELDKLHAEQAAPVEQAAETPAAPVDMRSAAEIIAARFTELDGVRAVIKGAGTAAPVVWLAGDTEKHADAIRAAGAKWSGKRSAYYIRVA